MHGAPQAPTWADFYSITLADTTAIYWVTNYPGKTVSWTSPALNSGAHTYTVAGTSGVPGLKRSSIKETLGLDVDELKVELICDAGSLLGYVRPEAAALAGTLDGASVVLERAYFTGDWVEQGSIYRYKGTVSGVEVETGKVTLTVSSPMSQLSRTLPRNFYTPLCGHALFDAGCAIARSPNWTWTEANTAYYSADGITATEFRINRATSVSAWTTGFICSIGLPNGSRWNCTLAGIDVSGTYTYHFELDQPQPVGALSSGTFSSNVEARCDKSIAQCRDLFSNLNRRRGFDFVPAADSVTRNTGLKSYSYSVTVPKGGKGGGRTYYKVAKEQRYEAQTCAYGRPISIVYGTQRIGGNIILGGKYLKDQTTGGASKATISDGLVILALCEGPIDTVQRIWIEKVASVLADHSTWTLFVGDRTVTTDWSALSTHTDIRLRYSGTALICDASAWSQSATGELENATYVVRGLYASATFEDPTYTGAYDTLPSNIIYHLLHDSEIGLGLDINFVGPGAASATWQDQCYGMDAFISMAVVEPRESRELAQEVLDATFGAVTFSEGSWKYLPKSLIRLEGSLGDYIPNLTPIYDLGYRAVGSDFLADAGEPPISVERPNSDQRYNCFPIEYTSRSSSRKDVAGNVLTEPANEYRLTTFDGEANPGDVALRGLIKAPVSSLPCITRLAHARTLSRLLADESVTRTATYRWRMPWRLGLAEVGDLVTITDSNLSLSRELVRLTEITEAGDGSFEVVAQGLGYRGTVPAATYTLL